jgi:hypothetical protein
MLAYLVDGNLLTDCEKCKKSIRLIADVKCQACQKMATRFFVKGLSSPLIPFYFCDEHFSAYRKRRRLTANRLKAYALPFVGTGLVIISFLDKSSRHPFLPFILAGVFCWAVAILSWKKLRNPSPEKVEEEDDE